MLTKLINVRESTAAACGGALCRVLCVYEDDTTRLQQYWASGRHRAVAQLSFITVVVIPRGAEARFARISGGKMQEARVACCRGAHDCRKAVARS
jgi:hypothetical protein